MLLFSPVIPVIALVTADHWTAIITFITARADPDLITPLVKNLLITHTRQRLARKKKIVEPEQLRQSNKLTANIGTDSITIFDILIQLKRYIIHTTPLIGSNYSGFVDMIKL